MKHSAQTAANPPTKRGTYASSRALALEDGKYRSAGAILVADRRLTPTPVFDTYWRFAAERHAVYQARIRGEDGPWTQDKVIAGHRFTNCYRAADRVSQYLISNVAYLPDTDDPIEVMFRILLFKMFNKVETWQALCEALDETPTHKGFDVEVYNRILGSRIEAGTRLYSAAYIVPPPPFGAVRKHTNHLRLLAYLLHQRVLEHVRHAPTMRDAYRLLAELPGIGPFLAYQFLIDLNYSAALSFDEMDFVVPGPGARDGIRKCFGDSARGIEADIIAYMAEHQDEHFTRLGLTFGGLYGRPLQLIDCQNLFCEVDKYARVVHPDHVGHSGRTRIKQKFTANPSMMRPWFPPKWGLNDKVGEPALAS
ncbi:nucleotide kinase domain-containing protein [Humibacillus xanthopallidus]|uniref:5-hmdU DNA kinase helical domain-containing protein n=1 Tax=Humibacillus xanthopallidus TaxID=412689 RepID=A0A543HHQ1_9MICO|nr:nucleotide kinase domain-containing protein [Humibacillus xanthopallidus]TQM57849.1 hypothetical protein FBY41_3185 [Humibacillus xanthopallidus]